MMSLPLRTLGAILLLTGCEPESVLFLPDLGTEEFPQTDFFGLPGGELGIDDGSVLWGCNPAGTAFSLDFRTFGPAGGGTLTVVTETGFIEEHELLLTDAAPNGSWDRYAVGPLLDQTPEADFLSGTNTTAMCEGSDPTTIIQIIDRFGELQDCVWHDHDGVPPIATSIIESKANLKIGGCRFLSSYSY
ncbi:MAG: hypothetical protein AAGA48_27815 [Myxococcota bacterium]